VVLLIGGGHALTGTVRHVDGTPAIGARVAICPDGARALRRVVRTGSDGSYRIGSLPPGLYQVAAAPTEGAFCRVTTITVPADETCDITLRPTGTILGRVTLRADGTPIEGATVFVGIQSSLGTCVLTATTDAEGRYRVEHIPHRRNTRITALAPGLVPPDEEHDYHWLYIDGGSERVVDFKLRAGAVVVGVVRDPDGKPVAGAEVRLSGSSAWRQRFFRETATDREGTFRFGALPTGHAFVWARADGLHQPGAPGSPGQPGLGGRIVIPASGETFVTIDLEPTGRIEGLVLDDEDREIAGVLVNVSQEGVPRVETGPDGSFSIDSVGSGVGIVLEATSAAGIPGRSEPIAVAPGETVRGVRIRLPPVAVVRGTVRAESGEALHGATVRLGLLEVDEPGLLHWETACEYPVAPDGTFEIPITEPAGWFAVYAQAAGLPCGETRTMLIVPGVWVFTAHLVLPEPVVLDGIVIDAGTGEPVPGAMVRVTSALHDARQRTVTGADGRFRIRVRPGEDSGLHVSAEGYVYLYRPDVAAGTRDLRAEVCRSAEIRGRIISEDGAPAPNLAVRASRRGARDGKAWSGADGRFVIRGIAEGMYRVSIRPDEDGGRDYVAMELPSVATGGPELVITVARAARIEGRVVDEDGEGLPGVKVVARDPETRRGDGRVLSGPDGSFVLPVLSGGEYTVTTGRSGRTLVPATVQGVSPGTIGLTIILKRGLTIAGQLVDENGVVVEGLWSRLDLGEEAESDFYIFGKVRKDGTFEFRGLPEGVFTLYFLPGQSEGWLGRTVQGISAGTTDLRIEIRCAGSILGVVVDEAGLPVEGVGVIAAGEEQSWWSWGAAFDTWTDHKGRFSVGGLPPEGKYVIVVGGSEEGWSSAAEKDVATGREDLRFVIRKGLAIRGGVWEADGDPVGDAVVAVLDADGFPVAWTEVAHQGSFELSGLPTGRAMLWVLRTEKGAKPVRAGSFTAGATDIRVELPAD